MELLAELKERQWQLQEQRVHRDIAVREQLAAAEEVEAAQARAAALQQEVRMCRVQLASLDEQEQALRSRAVEPSPAADGDGSFSWRAARAMQVGNEALESMMSGLRLELLEARSEGEAWLADVERRAYGMKVEAGFEIEWASERLDRSEAEVALLERDRGELQTRFRHDGAAWRRELQETEEWSCLEAVEVRLRERELRQQTAAVDEDRWALEERLEALRLQAADQACIRARVRRAARAGVARELHAAEELHEAEFEAKGLDAEQQEAEHRLEVASWTAAKVQEDLRGMELRELQHHAKALEAAAHRAAAQEEAVLSLERHSLDVCLLRAAVAQPGLGIADAGIASQLLCRVAAAAHEAAAASPPPTFGRSQPAAASSPPASGAPREPMARQELPSVVGTDDWALAEELSEVRRMREELACLERRNLLKLESALAELSLEQRALGFD